MSRTITPIDVWYEFMPDNISLRLHAGEEIMVYYMSLESLRSAVEKLKNLPDSSYGIKDALEILNVQIKYLTERETQ